MRGQNPWLMDGARARRVPFIWRPLRLRRSSEIRCGILAAFSQFVQAGCPDLGDQMSVICHHALTLHRSQLYRALPRLAAGTAGRAHWGARCF